MMRIHELIQRKKIIQSLNENYVTMQQLDKQEKFDLQQAQGIQQKLDEAKKKRSVRILPHTPDGNNHTALCPCSSTSPVTSPTSKTFETPADREARESIRILVRELSFKLNDLQKRALRVTWKRLTDAPRTSGRGTIHLMEKAFNKLIEKEPHLMSIFYKCAFVSCIIDKAEAKRRVQGEHRSIATVRDHARLLVDLIDGIINALFGLKSDEELYDPSILGAKHARLEPLGFRANIWETFGECFADVMYTQECVRAYPHAAKAWSVVIISITDKMYRAYEQANMKHRQDEQNGLPTQNMWLESRENRKKTSNGRRRLLPTPKVLQTVDLENPEPIGDMPLPTEYTNSARFAQRRVSNTGSL